jgi:hypothetical protein
MRHVPCAAQVYIYMEALRTPLEALALGDVEGGWEGVKEIVDQILHCMREVRGGGRGSRRAL